jgi:isopenicillin-N epimerase
MCAPKGAGFAYARPEIQDRLVLPHARSRGWAEDRLRGSNGESLYVPLYQSQGTRDPAAFLSVPSAIEFQREHDWDAQRARCHALAGQTRARVNALTGLEPLCPDSPAFYGQMASFSIPEEREAAIRQELADRNIVVVLLRVNERLVMRVSYQAYNSQQDADRLVEAVTAGLG